MVLTNFDMWVADCTVNPNARLEFETTTHSRQLNPFDPHHGLIERRPSNLNHLTSNGYYGFSYLTSPHAMEINNNNNNYNYNDNQNNNNIGTPNLMVNHVNGMNNVITAAPDSVHRNVVCSSAADSAVSANQTQLRCKKRHFIMNDTNDKVHVDYEFNMCNNVNDNHHSAKRCRYDNNDDGKNNADFSAQYCNDFFNLPSTQIATQSCSMETDEMPQSLAGTASTTQWSSDNNSDSNNNEALQQQNQGQQHLQDVSHTLQNRQHMFQSTHNVELLEYKTTAKTVLQQHCTQFHKCNNNNNNNDKSVASAIIPMCHHSKKQHHHVVDDDDYEAMLFTQIHGGFLHHYSNNNEQTMLTTTNEATFSNNKYFNEEF